MAIIDTAREELERLLSEFDAEHQEARKPLVEAIERMGSKPKRRPPGRPPKASKGQTAAAPKRRRRKTGVTRREQMIDILGKNPGISSGDVAEKMGIESNYIYRIKNELEKEGLLRAEGRQLRLTSKGIEAAEGLRREFEAGESNGSGSSASKAAKKSSAKKAKAKRKGGNKRKSRGAAKSKSKAKSSAKTAAKESGGAGKEGAAADGS